MRLQSFSLIGLLAIPALAHVEIPPGLIKRHADLSKRCASGVTIVKYSQSPECFSLSIQGFDDTLFTLPRSVTPWSIQCYTHAQKSRMQPIPSDFGCNAVLQPIHEGHGGNGTHTSSGVSSDQYA
ncbi:Efflux pump rdc3 [Fusarium oxysporum f. sp. albedinis]|nr:Efflux pump rdc3 [Fusarium oxysporum f. sp. albedinis]